MPRSLEDEVEKLQDTDIVQGLALQSHQQTIDQVVMPLVKKVTDLEEALQDAKDELLKLRTTFKTVAGIGGLLVTIIGLVIGYLQLKGGP